MMGVLHSVKSALVEWGETGRIWKGKLESTLQELQLAIDEENKINSLEDWRLKQLSQQQYTPRFPFSTYINWCRHIHNMSFQELQGW